MIVGDGVELEEVDCCNVFDVLDWDNIGAWPIADKMAMIDLDE